MGGSWMGEQRLNGDAGTSAETKKKAVISWSQTDFIITLVVSFLVHNMN